MKTILSLLLLSLLIVSCARKAAQDEWPPYAFAASETAPREVASPGQYSLPAEQEATVPHDLDAETAAAQAVAQTNVVADVVVTNAAVPSPFGRPPQPAVPALGAGAGGTTPGMVGLTTAQLEETIPAGLVDARNMPLEDFLKIYGEYVGKTLLRPANLTGQGGPQITLTTRTPMTRRELIAAMDEILGMNGIAVINVDDKIAKVVPVGQAGQEGAPVDTRAVDELANLGPYVSHVVQLTNVKPSEVVQALQPFQRVPNSVIPIDSSQILVIRDYTANVKRMLEMIKQIDVVVPSEFISEVIPIKYAKAGAIADALTSLSGGSGGSTTISRGTTAPAGTTRGATRPGAGGYTAPGQPQQNPIATPQAGTAAAGQGGSFTDRLNSIIRRAATGSGDLQIIGTTKIIADERSNSLLIFASRQDMEMIKGVVEKLDVVLAQVLIETVIMDVQVGNALAYGVSAGQGPNGSTNGFGFGGVNNNPASGGSTPLDTLARFFQGLGSTNLDLTGSRFPASSSGLSYFGRYRGDLDVVIQAAASDSRVNVVQKPRILTSHATPGSIFVGSTVPYVTSTYYGGGFGGGPSSSYQQLSVGIGLEVTPFINPDGLVVMTINETIDEIAGSTDIQGVGSVPNTTRRELRAEVAVRDGDTIILGGFIRNSSNKQNAGIPLLKDIPLLGALFTSRSDAKERQELLVMMRPTVLKTPDIAALASDQEKKRLPGVRAAEAEVLELEKKEMERQRKREARSNPDGDRL